MPKVNISDLASAEYHGTYGITRHCLEALARLIHYGEVIEKAKVLTWKVGQHCEHAFVLILESERMIFIKAGFTSGYDGEGPRGFSTALKLLQAHNIEIDEYRVTQELMIRLNASCLLDEDIDWLEYANPVRPLGLYDYLYDGQEKILQELFPPVINFGLIDDRIFDLALNFQDNSDHSILTAFKRLEDIIRIRTQLPSESGVKLFSKAFLGEDSLLDWQDESPAEHNSKANLFKDIFGAFRNPRAHREVQINDQEAVREFMLVNELYCLEAKAVERKLVASHE
jgi:hypothetical protein